MGGKSSGRATPPPAMPDTSAKDAQLVKFMQQMLSSQAALASQTPAPPPIPDTPKVERNPITDWATKNAELLAKSRADYRVGQARRKGRKETVLTSPLLDGETTDTTQSLLVGGTT